MPDQELNLDHLLDLLTEMEGLDINTFDPNVLLQIMADAVADFNEIDDDQDSANDTDAVRAVPQDDVPDGPERRRAQGRNASRRARARRFFERVFLSQRERELPIHMAMMERVCTPLQEYLLANLTAAQHKT